MARSGRGRELARRESCDRFPDQWFVFGCRYLRRDLGVTWYSPCHATNSRIESPTGHR